MLCDRASTSNAPRVDKVGSEGVHKGSSLTSTSNATADLRVGMIFPHLNIKIRKTHLQWFRIFQLGAKMTYKIKKKYSSFWSYPYDGNVGGIFFITFKLLIL